MDTKLHEAVRYGDLSDVVKALNQGYDPNLVGLYEWSPVHEAAHNGELDILKLLLRYKGDANHPDDLRGNTAVHYSAEQGHLACLKLLLEVGGHPHLLNSDNQSAFDVAVGECRDYLEEYDMDNYGEVSTKVKDSPVDDHNNNMETKNEESNEERRNSSTGVPKGDSSEDFPAMGHLHLSFEYHAHKLSLKIRVWQVSDLLLPPPHTSMINTVFVRSYLIPDKPKKTNRRTEDVKVAPSEAHIATNRTQEEPGIQYVFTPSSFHFSMPLIYTGVTPEIVEERSVQIEVCMTQRYTKRVFLIGMINLPLKSSVKMLLREKYPLIPCMNYTIPNNMKVYSASELQLESNLGMFYSSPLLRDLGRSVPNRSESDVELQGIMIHRDEDEPYVSINMQNGSHDFEPELESDLQEVKVKRKIVPDFSSIDIPHIEQDQLLPGQLEEVKVEGDVNGEGHCVVDMDKQNSNKKKIKPPKFNSDMEIEMEHIPKSIHFSANSDESDLLREANGVAETSVNSPAHSRPETPVWDFYDFDDFELGMEPLQDYADGDIVENGDVSIGNSTDASDDTVIGNGDTNVHTENGIVSDLEEAPKHSSNAENGHEKLDTVENGDAKMDYKGVSLSQSAVKAMKGHEMSKVNETQQKKLYIPAIIVDDIENEDNMFRL